MLFRMIPVLSQINQHKYTRYVFVFVYQINWTFENSSVGEIGLYSWQNYVSVLVVISRMSHKW